MKLTEHITKSGHRIAIYDDLFEFNERMFLLDRCRRLPFEFSEGYDALLNEGSSGYTCKSVIEPQTLQHYKFVSPGHNGPTNIRHLSGIFPLHKEEFKNVWQEVGTRQMHRMWVNACHIADNPKFHSDEPAEGPKSMLIYLNMKWDTNWDGGTAFKSADGVDIEYYVEYKPGRLVFFDSIIPHKAMTPSADAPAYRFTFNTIWIPKDYEGPR